MFLWRALSGALAVSVCLQAHGMNTDLTCSLCQDAIESISHVLFQCWPAREVWEITNIPMPNQGFTDSLHDNLAFILKLMSNDGVSLNMRMAIPWILWGIWKHRNGIKYAGTQGDLNALVTHALEEAEVWNKLMEAPSHSSSGRATVIRLDSRWSKPPLEMLKSSNRIAAELRGFLWMLHSLYDLHLNNIEVWSDCNAAVEAIIDSPNWPRYHSYLDRIHRLLPQFGKVIFKVSSTKANGIAREIALSVTRDGRGQSYLARGGPVWLQSRIDEEKRR
ncbi:Reverse transcriptase zinc-binding domain [Arabidopsis suecica]|uniref:Reverse transcriptase zinc-binding domain n=1 Tax=Arabidopsis suecica TaxID=45249 RepID=A0A8T1YGT5_ARASU|nr:Reverse transcriptase zinc-binding domain [Arabidopsis suecica]